MTAGFGLEKLGLFSLRYPWLCLVAAMLVTPVLAYGASQLEFSSDIREIFRSDDPAFRQLELVEERFPDRQRDIQIVVSSDTAFDLKELEALRTLHRELENLEGVQSLLSMFSAVQIPKENSELQLLFPDDLGRLENWDDLRRQRTRNPLIADKLLADDGSLAIFPVSLIAEERSVEEDRPLRPSVLASSQELTLLRPP